VIKTASPIRRALLAAAILSLIVLSPVVVAGSKTNPSITTVKVGPNPTEIAYNPSSKLVYVTLDPAGIVEGPNGPQLAPGNVVVIQNTTVVANLTVGIEPAGLVYDSADSDMYVGVRESQGSGFVVNVISGTKVVANITGVTGWPVLFNPHDNDVYLLDRSPSYNDNLTVISGTTVVGRVSVGSVSVAAVACDPMNGYIYIARTNPSPYGMVIVSGTMVIGTVNATDLVDQILTDPSNGYVYFSTYNSDVVSVLSGVNLTAKLAVGPQAGSYPALGLAYNPANHYVYVSNPSTNAVTVISGTAVIANVTVGSAPTAMTYDPANGYMYVSNSESKTVSVISGTSVVATIPVPSSFQSVLYYNPSDENLYGYVPQTGDSGVFTIFSGTSVVGNLTISYPGPIIYDPSNNDTYFINHGSDTVAVMSTSGSAVSGSWLSGSMTIIIAAVVLLALGAVAAITLKRRATRPVQSIGQSS
jgi:YVTN family beta-propeller protein